MYMQFGRVRDASRVFEEMPVINGDVFNSLIYGFRRNGFNEEVVVAFRKMVESCYVPNLDSVFHVIMACGKLGSIVDGNLIHDYVVQNGYNAHVTIANALISMYVKMGRLDLGHEVFSDLVARDVVSWNTLITGYAQSGNWMEAFDLFLCMREATNVVPNKVTLLGLLSACGQAENLGFGMSIHGHLIRAGLLSDFRLGTAVVDMYAKCESFDRARAVFEEDLFEKTLVSWNSLIAGYTRNGYAEEAVILYEMMTVELKLKPDSITFSNVVPAYASLANHGRIQSIHSLIVKKGFDMDGDVVLGTAMIDAYGKCLDLKAAKSLFTCIEGRNTATWNALIAAYNVHSHADQVMPLFVEMNRAQEVFDAITMVVLCQSCGELRSLKQGSMVHGLCHSKGFNSHLSVGNSIVDMYMRCGCVDRAEAFFNSMSFKNIVTWNIMFYGYVRSGHSATAIRVFRKLQLENLFKPDSVTIISFIQASSTAFICHGGEISHCHVLKLGLDSEIWVINSLLDAYAKNGLIECAKALFMQVGNLRDQSSWNVMIAGCGMNGQGREACDLLSQMEEDGHSPDSITFTSLLSCCSHCGLVSEGCRFFEMMVTKYNIQPDVEHWTCIIDLFGRSGKLEEAYQMIKSGLHQNYDAVWGALMSSCKTNMNMELGELIGDKLAKLAPDNCGYHLLLSNLYASSKRWGEVAKARRVFEDGRMVKKLGLSVIEC
ncbi:hypothetical protein RJ640_005816 [Escallonia rubra]|uniref:Pentatricopeptide repeat-containing protein n=1 Tax=Escallonia rubra TaxID=112253 RepID=A0AA88RFY4_9ASTE|nr:hypothetical protein RJ640_005816 [Escallonia rubra]